MPINEDDLRALLAERSEHAPTTAVTLAVRAERQGRLTRRRRRTAAAALSAGAVLTVLAGSYAVTAGGERSPATTRPAATARPVDVDVTVFRNTMRNGRWAHAKMVTTLTPAQLAALNRHVLTGTVRDFGLVQGNVLMQVQVDEVVQGGTRPGRTISIDLGPYRTEPKRARKPIAASAETVASYRKAVPPGARLLAFLADQDARRTEDEPDPNDPTGPVDPNPTAPFGPSVLTVRFVQSLIFQDTTGLVGAFVDLDHTGWTPEPTMPELVERLRARDCDYLAKSGKSPSLTFARTSVNPAGAGRTVVQICSPSGPLSLSEARRNCPEVFARLERETRETSDATFLTLAELRCLVGNEPDKPRR